MHPARRLQTPHWGVASSAEEATPQCGGSKRDKGAEKTYT